MSPFISVILQVLCFVLVLQTMLLKPSTQNSATMCSLQIISYFEDYEYYQEGDIIIGGIFTVHSAALDHTHTDKRFDGIICFGPSVRHYVNVLMFLVAIDQINNNPKILLNITLGYHIYDSCLDTRKALKNVFQILSGSKKTIPNYSCMKYGKLAGFIGDHFSVTTIPMAQILSVLGYSQISYGATDYLLGDRSIYPYFLRMVQNDYVHYLILCNILNHFGWNWIGIISSDDPSGEQEIQVVLKFMATYGICAAYIIRANKDLIEKKIISLQVAKTSSAQLHHFIKKIRYVIDSNGPMPYFDLNGEFVYYYMIINWLFTNENIVIDNLVGNITPWAPKHQQLVINEEAILWKTAGNKIPVSQCSKDCLPGYRKCLDSSIQTCCHSCVQCSDGEISLTLNSENCIKCPEYEWPNENKYRCIPKEVEYLSYMNDILAVLFAATSIFFCILTLLILKVFISYRDTHIVKANNRNLSFTLLISIALSFICVFLFLGRPLDITCMLRQVSFGVIFSVSVSCVLAKTIIVYTAFKVTKPGSKLKTWIGVKMSNSIVLILSSIQVIISICWLAISPPFQEMDTRSYQWKIIIQCNEGSVIAFYSVLGYMGLLATVSFVMAFLARTLPDSFNEAKYITFSMLVFCSVWIAMIPAYLSTKGKYMVAVEVFAILTSNAGLLGCIFLPKCYIILIRPEMNKKTNVLGKRN
ncbi:vomeronasal type-2 receptor 26-like [Pelobates fuscus]|uniref:vomeronasal type-2 receptor 26-like n=1 Tax=Pelobates fuscus TaxID=191477 RepID=UPI002FE494D0